MATAVRRSMVAFSRLSGLAAGSSPGRRRALYSGGGMRDAELEAAVRDVVCSGAGSLDEVGGMLDRLGVAVSPAMVRRVIDSCSERGDSSRRLLRFLSWCRSKDPWGLGDEALDRAIGALARMGDLTALRIAVGYAEKDGRRMSPETFTVVVETLVKTGKEDEAVRLFRGLERQRLLPQCDAGVGGEGIWSSSLAMVQALCMKGHAREAQGVVWHHKRELLVEPMVSIVQRSLLHGWCVHGNAKEARSVLDDIKSSHSPLGLPSFNDYLHCLCHRNLKFNPSALVPEAMDILAEMMSYVLIQGHARLMDSTQEQQQDFGVLLKQGAEGRVFVSTFVGRKCVIKERFSKKYRHPLLDSKLTLKRLNAEARCMTKARKLGVPTPVLYAVDPLLHTLTFEYVDGLSVKDILLGFGSNGVNEEQLNHIATQIGNAVGKLHDGGLVHGDLTTSNMIIKNSTNQLVLIDFGLSFISTIPEDKAVDLYVLERALISMHSSCGDVKIFKAMVCHYEQASSSQAAGQKANNDWMKLNLDLLDNREWLSYAALRGHHHDDLYKVCGQDCQDFE
ncbi:hypothetical protein E2562_024460 [Oryza meyeriana var. granulata]|uniref:non-specific serine/threonine protein kinase n=1 Tax=Oryza meyeriana var. granulata TaxID=110450 RepID=A0A6G1EYX6_9ORYZ|nr:hypothetical protein E2562_024460 [Oryza meyeriana var. granulata]